MEVNLKIPSVGESILEVTIGEWIKKTGDFVSKGEIICELESEKATFDFTSTHNGILKILKKTGETASINEVIAIVQESVKEESKIENKIDGKSQIKDQESKSKTIISKNAENSNEENIKEVSLKYPSPASEKIILEQDLDLSKITGTGKDGRIIKGDLFPISNSPKITEEDMFLNKDISIDKETNNQNIHVKRMSQLRKTIAKRLVTSKNEAAILTTFNEVDLFEIKNLRSVYQDIFFKKYNVKLGFMSFFTKAATLALKEFPEVNAKIEGDNIIYHNYSDIAIAVSIPKGLVTPVIRNTENLTFDQIELKIIELAQKAKESKLSMDEMLGGTFTITNGGIFGSMLSTPIINPPQSAILGMHNIVDRPFVINGEIKIRPIMYLALSYDHRIIDGKEASGFLYRIKEMIESPIRMLLKI